MSRSVVESSTRGGKGGTESDRETERVTEKEIERERECMYNRKSV